MLDLSPIANAIKSVQAPPPQAMPSATEELKAVPQAEIEHAVPPLPAKGGEPGLGEHLDLYDTEAAKTAGPPKDAAAANAPVAGTPVDPATSQAAAQAIAPAPADLPDPVKVEAAKKEKAAAKMELLGDKTGLPQPTTDPPPAELPFLTPLGGKALGQAIDARI